MRAYQRIKYLKCTNLVAGRPAWPPRTPSHQQWS
jgi:hypothetical protein